MYGHVQSSLLCVALRSLSPAFHLLQPRDRRRPAGECHHCSSTRQVLVVIRQVWLNGVKVSARGDRVITRTSRTAPLKLSVAYNKTNKAGLPSLEAQGTNYNALHAKAISNSTLCIYFSPPVMTLVHHTPDAIVRSPDIF